MPAAARSMPRMMLPPPTTIASSTPDSWTPAISSASDSIRSWSIPNSRSPESASPESFSRTRSKLVPAAVAAGMHEHAQLVRRRVDVGAEHVAVVAFVADGVANDDVLAQLGDDLCALLLELLRRLGAVLLDRVEHALREDHELFVVRDG